MVDTATELTATTHEEVQKPIMFDYQKKVNETSVGDLGIPELLDKDCVTIRGKILNSLTPYLIHYLIEHANSIDALSANPVNQNEFITGSHDKTLMLWDATKAKMIKCFKGNNQGIWNVNFTQNGKNFVTASPEGVCKMWDARAGKEVQQFKAHTRRVSVEFLILTFVLILGVVLQGDAQ